MPEIKKNRKKCFWRWTDKGMLTILNALFVLISVAISAENIDNEDILKHKEANQAHDKAEEFIENLNKRLKTDISYWRIQKSIAKILTNPAIATESNPEQMAKDFTILNRKSKDLAFNTIIFCDYLTKILEDGTLKQLDYIRTKIRLDELRQQANQLYFMLDSSRAYSKDECRILDINKDLKVVVLTYGSAQGVKAGLKWNIKNNDKVTTLKTVLVRPFICATVVENGQIQDLIPGMTAKAGSN